MYVCFAVLRSLYSSNVEIYIVVAKLAAEDECLPEQDLFCLAGGWPKMQVSMSINRTGQSCVL